MVVYARIKTAEFYATNGILEPWYIIVLYKLKRSHRSNDLETHLTVYKLSRPIKKMAQVSPMLIETHKYLHSDEMTFRD